jgi:hypothetical protein
MAHFLLDSTPEARRGLVGTHAPIMCVCPKGAELVKRFLPVTIGGAVLAVLIAVGLLVWFSVAGWWPVVVDIAIVVTCVVSLALLAFLGAAVFYLTVTLLNLKRELTPVLESLRSTTHAVRETARVASDLGVAPTVRTASVLVGAVETASAVLGRGRVKTRAQKRAQRKSEVQRELLARGELNGLGS